MGSVHIVKKCGSCKVIKPVDDFYASGRRGGRDGFCKECRRERDRARAKSKATTEILRARRNAKLKSLYGISLDEYESMAEQQGHACGICGAAETRSMYGEQPRLVVDHNHQTGAVRKLLCCACNGRLGAIEDEQFMLLARQYIRDCDGYEFVNDMEAVTA